MTTQPIIRCGRYQCHKVATQMPAGTNVEPGKNLLANLYCNAHAGAEKRSTYPRVAKFWEPISDEVMAAARAQQAGLDAQRRKRESEDAAREHERQRGLAAYYWKERAEEDEYVIIYSEEGRTAGVRRIWTIQTKTLAEATDEESVERRRWHREGQVIVDDRGHYPDVTFPVDVDTHWSSRPTPRLAIAMADAMRQAAIVAEAINARLIQKHNEEKS